MINSLTMDEVYELTQTTTEAHQAAQVRAQREYEAERDRGEWD